MKERLEKIRGMTLMVAIKPTEGLPDIPIHNDFGGVAYRMYVEFGSEESKESCQNKINDLTTMLRILIP